MNWSPYDLFFLGFQIFLNEQSVLEYNPLRYREEIFYLVNRISLLLHGFFWDIQWAAA